MKRLLLTTFTFFLGLQALMAASVATKTITATLQVTNGPVVDNFDDGANPNVWGGWNGVFVSNNYIVRRASAAVTYDRANAYGASGYCLAVKYDVSESAQYAGCYTELTIGGGASNISAYKYLSLFVKGAATERSFKVEMKNANGESSSLYVTDYLDGGITTSWKQLLIPLDAFVNLSTLSNVTQIVFVFEHDYAAACGYAVQGTVYIDNLSFSTAVPSTVRVDHFGDSWGLNALGGNVGDMQSGDNAIHTHSYNSAVYHVSSNSLMSHYNVLSGWSGIWFQFGGAPGKAHDFSGYTKLTFWAKAQADNAKPAKITIELVDAAGARTAVIPDNTTTPAASISTAWQKHTVNFSAFSGLNPASIKQFNIIYSDSQVGANQAGTVYYDEIQFEK